MLLKVVGNFGAPDILVLGTGRYTNTFRQFGDAGTLTATAVPEPAAIAGGILAGGSLVCLQRRRKPSK